MASEADIIRDEMAQPRSFRLSGEIDGRRQTFLLPPGSHSVGSTAEEDVSLPVAGVSRRHAVVTVQAETMQIEAVQVETVLIRDLGSKNGTYIEGLRIEREAQLELGQTVEFGSVALTLEEVEIEDVELGLTFGAIAEFASSDSSPAATSAISEVGRTLSVERRNPTTLLLIETLDRLWTEVPAESEHANSALVRFARQTFSARAAALVERIGDSEPSVLAIDGELGSELDLATEIPNAEISSVEVPSAENRSSENALGFSFTAFGRHSEAGAGEGVYGRLVVRSSEDTVQRRRRDLMLWRPAAQDAVMSPLLHLMLLWSSRATPAGTAAELSKGSGSSRAESVLHFPEGHVPGESEAMLELYDRLGKVAPGGVPVLLLGETGVGKEHIAKLLHLSSPRRLGPMVAVNCAAIPGELLEAELFGIKGGVATGVRARRGKLEAAHGGTLLLDEIGDMPKALQAKLLRVLQEKRVEPLGGAPVDLDVRVLAATHADLHQLVDEGRFRRDLYYRLAGFEARIPPLRGRRADIPRLIEVFARRFCGEAGKTIRGVTVKALRALLEHSWPGNVRELEHEVRRLVYLTVDGEAVEWGQLSDALRGANQRGLNQQDDHQHGSPTDALIPRLEALERQCIVEALEATGGNQTRAAARLDISRNGLIQRMKRLDIPSSTGR